MQAVAFSCGRTPDNVDPSLIFRRLAITGHGTCAYKLHFKSDSSTDLTLKHRLTRVLKADLSILVP